HQQCRSIRCGRRFNPWIKEDLYNENCFIGLFRMGRQDFFLLIRVLLNYIPNAFQQDVRGLTIEEKVRITLYRLGHGTSYDTVGHVFNVGKATAYQVSNEKLILMLCIFPAADDVEKWAEIKESFRLRQGLRNIIGAIDGTHIPIIPPANDQ
ncbi:hypothetical protein O181_091672, partial [Austropuccinia psidii MF-1]|nr:hypothetical protein [Austropuccinia psidii MF-1]